MARTCYGSGKEKSAKKCNIWIPQFDEVEEADEEKPVRECVKKYSPASKNRRLEKAIVLKKRRLFMTHLEPAKTLYSPITSFTPIPIKASEDKNEVPPLETDHKCKIEKATGIPNPSKYETPLVVHFIRSKRLPYTYKHRELNSDITEPTNLLRVSPKKLPASELKNYGKISRLSTMAEQVDNSDAKRLRERIRLERDFRQLPASYTQLFKTTLKYKCCRNISFNMMLRNKMKTIEAKEGCRQVGEMKVKRAGRWEPTVKNITLDHIIPLK